MLPSTFALLHCLPLAASLFADRQEPLALGRIDAPIAFAPARIVFLPREGRDDGRARRGCSLEQAKRSPCDFTLHILAPRMAARVPERKIAEHEARNPAVLDHVERGADDDRRKPILFQVPRYQTHGLVADRS